MLEPFSSEVVIKAVIDTFSIAKFINNVKLEKLIGKMKKGGVSFESATASNEKIECFNNLLIGIYTSVGKSKFDILCDFYINGLNKGKLEDEDNADFHATTMRSISDLSIKELETLYRLSKLIEKRNEKFLSTPKENVINTGMAIRLGLGGVGAISTTMEISARQVTENLHALYRHGFIYIEDTQTSTKYHLTSRFELLNDLVQFRYYQ